MRAEGRVVVPFVLALACSGSEHETRRADAGPGPSDERILAVVDGAAIRVEEVDAPLLLELHELEQAAYARRLERLQALIRGRLGAGVEPGSAAWDARVEIRLEPPRPPRLAIPRSPSPSRGPETAPVTLVVFVDLESPHCRRLQADLIRVLDAHPDRVRLELRDLPLPYHRQALLAARAAHCAGEQDAYWPYHDRVLLAQPALAPADLERHADRLALDREAFSSCLASDRHEERIRADLALAASLGVRRAPTVFVNGLYLSGRPDAEAIERVVHGELTRLGLAEPSDEGARLEAQPGAAAPTEAAVDRDDESATWPHLSPEEMPEPELILTLDRAEIARALEDRDRLADALEASPGTFSGRRLLKLRRVGEDDLYARLGLEPGDVLLLIDGRFLTTDHNRLWDALAEQDELTLLVMRRGRPHVFLYRIR